MSDVIPFGKYRGQEITQVIQRDPAYVQWLTQQAWFPEKFSPIYQLVINNFAPASEETPAHNALQVRFLDLNFRAAVWLASGYNREIDWEKLHEAFLRQYFTVPRYYRGSGRPYADAHLKQHRAYIRTLWSRWRRRRDISGTTLYSAPQFEEISDVTFQVTPSIGLDDLTQRGNTYVVMIEIKPSMGDDYPVVLRQMKRQRSSGSNYDRRWILLVDQFASQSVTLDQVRAVFTQDQIRLVMMTDVRDRLVTDANCGEAVGRLRRKPDKSNA
jgi:hypothetical protein